MPTTVLRRHSEAARATPAFYWLEFWWGVLHSLAFALVLLYQVQTVGLSPFQLVIVGTVLEATCFLGEVPTGVVADLYSRRLSVLIGLSLMGAGIVVQGAIPVFWAVLFGQVIWGIGFTFTSGATEAWITDEVGEANVQKLFTRGAQLGLAGTVIGTVAAGGLGLVELRLPILLAGCGFITLALLLAFRMPERNFAPVPREDRATFRHMAQTFTAGLEQARRRPIVRRFFLISILVGLSSEAFDRLWVAHVVDVFDFPDVGGGNRDALWFAGIALASTVVSLVASVTINRLSSKAINKSHPKAVLAVLVLAQAGGMVALATAGHLWLAIAALWVRDAARVIALPVQSAWLNRNVDSSSRATMLSINSQANALGQVAGGPPLGALASRTSIPAALVVSSIILAPAAAIYLRARPTASLDGSGPGDEPEA